MRRSSSSGGGSGGSSQALFAVRASAEDVVGFAAALGWLAAADILRAACASRTLRDRCELAVRALRHARCEALPKLCDAQLRGSLLARCDRLQYLELVALPAVTSDAIQGLGEALGGSLRELSVLRCPGIGGRAVKHLVLSCARLEALRTDVELGHVLEGLTQAREGRKVPLRELHVRGENELADSALAPALVPYLGELEALSVDNVWLAVLLEILGNPVRLRRLEASNCFSENSFERSFQIDDFTEELGSRWRVSGLRELHLEGFLAVDAVLGRVARGPSRAKLRVLDVGTRARCSTLEMVGEGCPNLEELYVSDCPLLGDRGVHAVVTKCRRLRVLRLAECPGVTSVTVQLLAQHVSTLESLDLSGCMQIDDDSLALLAAAPFAPRLRRLNLSGCRLVSDVGVKALCAVCTALSDLRLGTCNKLSNEGVVAIAWRLPRLAVLDLSWCLLVSPFSLEEVVLECHCLSLLVLKGCTHIPATEARLLAQRARSAVRVVLEGSEFRGKGYNPSREARALAAAVESADDYGARDGNEASSSMGTARTRKRKKKKKRKQSFKSGLLELERSAADVL